jgi:hypothetical protein
MDNIKIILSLLLVLTIGCCIYLFVFPPYKYPDCPNCPDCPVCPPPDCPKLPEKYPSTSVKPFPKMGKGQEQLIGYNGYSQLFLEAGLSPNINDEYLPDADNKCESADIFHKETKTCSNKGGLVAQFVAGLSDEVSGIHAYTYVIGKSGQIYNTPHPI